MATFVINSRLGAHFPQNVCPTRYLFLSLPNRKDVNQTPRRNDQFVPQTGHGRQQGRYSQTADYLSVHSRRRFEHHRSEQGCESERADRDQTHRGADRRGLRAQFRRAGDGRRTTAEYLRPESLCRVFRRRRSAQGFGHDAVSYTHLRAHEIPVRWTVFAT